MSIFSFFGGGANINEGVAEARETSGAVLVDVREADEYASGHIKDAVNVPLPILSGYPQSLRTARFRSFCTVQAEPVVRVPRRP